MSTEILEDIKDEELHLYYNSNTVRDDEMGMPVFDMENDTKAIKAYFNHVINAKQQFFHDHKEKIDYMVENLYWDKELLDKYTEDELIELFEIAFSYKFRFKSYMAANTFYEKYAMWTRDGKRVLERYEDRQTILALFYGDGDIEVAKEFLDVLITQKFQPATPSVLNIGRYNGGEMISCFLLEMNDSLNDINMTNSTARQLSKAGGGVSINITKTRAKGENLKGIENVTAGVLPIMKNIEQSFQHIDQAGQRKGAASVYLNILHADIEDFLRAKRITQNMDENFSLPTLSIGVVIPDIFIELLEKNKTVHLFYPHNFYQVTGEQLDEVDLTKRYYEFVDNPKIRTKQVEAEKLAEMINSAQMESGYPYLMFADNVNGEHQNNHISRVKFSNLCTEILQASVVSTYADYGEQDDIGLDISCNLGSLNILEVVADEEKNLEKTVALSIQALNRVSNESDVKNAPAVNRANRIMHSVGLGFMNLHGFYANNGVAYESYDALNFADVFFSAVRYYAMKESMLIAKRTGQTYYDFDGSGYADGTFFDDYIENKFPKGMTKKTSELLDGFKIPTKKDWLQLKQDVMKYGLYNSYLLAVAP